MNLFTSSSLNPSVSRCVPPHFKSLEIAPNSQFPDPTSDRALWTGQLDSWIRNVKTWRLKNRLWNFFWTGTTLLRIKWLIHCHVQIDFKSIGKNGTTKPSANDIRDSKAFGTLTSVENLSFGRRTSIINQSERINSKTENLINLIFLNRNGFRKKNPIFQFLEFC